MKNLWVVIRFYRGDRNLFFKEVIWGLVVRDFLIGYLRGFGYKYGDGVYWGFIEVYGMC